MFKLMCVSLRVRLSCHILALSPPASGECPARNTSGSGTINRPLSSMKQRLMPGPQVFKITHDEDGSSPPSRCRHRALFVTLEVSRVTSNYSPDFIALETFWQQLLPAIIPSAEPGRGDRPSLYPSPSPTLLLPFSFSLCNYLSIVIAVYISISIFPLPLYLLALLLLNFLLLLLLLLLLLFLRPLLYFLLLLLRPFLFLLSLLLLRFPDAPGTFRGARTPVAHRRPSRGRRGSATESS